MRLLLLPVCRGEPVLQKCQRGGSRLCIGARFRSWRHLSCLDAIIDFNPGATRILVFKIDVQLFKVESSFCVFVMAADARRFDELLHVIRDTGSTLGMDTRQNDHDGRCENRFHAGCILSSVRSSILWLCRLIHGSLASFVRLRNR